MTCFACRAYIPVDAWRPLAGPFYQDFVRNIETVNSVRCQACEEDTTLIAFSAYNPSPENVSADLARLLKLSTDLHCVERVQAALEDLNTGSLEAAGDVVEAVYALVEFDPLQLRWLLTTSPLRQSDPPARAEEDALVLKCIKDVERRVQVHAAYMRRSDANVTTPCCGVAVCFSCKYMDWHEGETCAQLRERTRDEYPTITSGEGTVEVFSCPSCYVQFEHAGGCSSIRCICGHEFSLDETY